MTLTPEFRARQAACPLLVTEAQINEARVEKHIGIIWMRPEDFLRLTTFADDNDWAREVSHRPVAPVAIYNMVTLRQGVPIPALAIEGWGGQDKYSTYERGRVMSHEGRHRAAAVMNANRMARMPVAIRLVRNRYSEYYVSDHMWRKTYYGLDDVPRLLLPQDFEGSPYLRRYAPVVLGDENFRGAINLWK